MAGLSLPRPRRVRSALAGLAAAWLLVACTAQGPTNPDDDTPPSGSGWLHPLRPLARQPPVPAGAPRSRVPAVNYDLSSRDDTPDDGVPGEAGEAFQRGGASWYGFQFHNRKTASGERFDMSAFTAAHKTLPFGTRVCVRSLVNGREVLVRINDRGPYAAGRIIDLSRAAAEAIDLIDTGIKQVALTIVDKDGGRCGGADVGSSSDDGSAAASGDDEAKPAAKRAPAKPRGTRKPAARR